MVLFMWVGALNLVSGASLLDRQVRAEFLLANLPEWCKPSESVQKQMPDWLQRAPAKETFEQFAARHSGHVTSDDLERAKRVRVSMARDFEQDFFRPLLMEYMMRAAREDRVDAFLFWSARLLSVTAEPLYEHPFRSYLVDFQADLQESVDLGRNKASLKLLRESENPKNPFSLYWNIEKLGAVEFQKVIDQQRIEDDDRGWREALRDVFDYGEEAQAFVGQREKGISGGAVAELQGRVERRVTLNRSTAELHAWPLVRVLRDIDVAYRIGKGDDKFRLTRLLLVGVNKTLPDYLTQRGVWVQDEEVYDAAHRPLADRYPVPGLVFEPAWCSGKSFSGHSLVVMAAVGEMFRKSGGNYATFNYFKLKEKGFPDPAKVPVMIMGGYQKGNFLNFMDGTAFEQKLKEYVDAGGRVIWIAGSEDLPSEVTTGVRALEVSAGTERSQWPLGKPFPLKSKLSFPKQRKQLEVVNMPRIDGATLGLSSRWILNVNEGEGTLEPWVTYTEGEAASTLVLGGGVISTEGVRTVFLPRSIFVNAFYERRLRHPDDLLKIPAPSKRLLFDAISWIKKK